jgi:hypothetical protein
MTAKSSKRCACEHKARGGDVTAPSAKPRLTEQDVRSVVTLLETWRGPLTWDLLVQRVGILLGRSYSRQALDSHPAIKATYQALKRRTRAVRDSLRKGKATTDELPPELAAALQRVDAAELRIQALEQIIEGYRGKFVRWLYNARNAGMTEEQLNADLPPIDQVTGALWSKRKARR